MLTRSIIRLLAIFFIFCSFQHSKVEAANLHAVLLADTYAENIEQGVEINLNAMKEEIERIAHFTQLDIKYYIFTDERANSNFIYEIDQMDVGQNDVIVFYWSGHGFRVESKDQEENIWPSFSFQYDPTGIDFCEVVEFLKKKDPRLLVALADTCNNYLPENGSPKMLHFFAFGFASDPLSLRMLKAEQYKTLFLNSSGSVVAAASLPGEFALYENKNFGGIFTVGFLGAIESEITSIQETDWEYVLATTLQTVESIRTQLKESFENTGASWSFGEQHPFYEINLR